MVLNSWPSFDGSKNNGSAFSLYVGCYDKLFFAGNNGKLGLNGRQIPIRQKSQCSNSHCLVSIAFA